MRNTVYLVGAGGHARSVINILKLNGIKIRGIYDDNYNIGEVVNGYRMAGALGDIKIDDKLVLAVGDNNKRELLFGKFFNMILKDNLTHASAIIEKNTEFGFSNLLFAGVYVNSNSKIGNNNILNTKSVIEHEVVIGSHNHISVGSILCGRVKVGNNCFIGAGAVVIDKLRIADRVTVGANSVVINDIGEPGTYVGNPAKKVK